SIDDSRAVGDEGAANGTMGPNTDVSLYVRDPETLARESREKLVDNLDVYSLGNSGRGSFPQSALKDLTEAKQADSTHVSGQTHPYLTAPKVGSQTFAPNAAVPPSYGLNRIEDVSVPGPVNPNQAVGIVSSPDGRPANVPPPPGFGGNTGQGGGVPA